MVLISPWMEIKTWAETPNNGLSVRFTSSGKTDTCVLPNLWLYVPNGQAPTPFLPLGEFTAHYTGQILVDLRGDYTFQAELQGALRLEINGVTVLDATNSPSKAVKGNLVRLNKGTNAISVNYKSPAKDDAFFRVEWIPKEDQNYPIPSTSLTHDISGELQSSKAQARGRELFVENRCIKCHEGTELVHGGMTELDYDAPSFEGIGSRRNFEWMRDWIVAPKKMRGSARMPQVFHGPDASKQAEAVAAFLSTLTTGTAAQKNLEPTADDIEGGKKLFADLHCVACHITPGVDEIDPLRNPLKHVGSKFSSGYLAKFMLAPDGDYSWSRMPKFHLKPEEAEQIAAYLVAGATQWEAKTPPTESALITQGQKLVQTSGCLNCHALKLPNQYASKALSDLTIDHWKGGCILTKPGSKAMNYQFSEKDQAALIAFAATDRESLKRHVGWEYAQRQQVNLKCVQCHGKFEGFPTFESIGSKIKPEWGASFIGGHITSKVRPWIDAQMPTFTKPAKVLAEGLSMLHGFPSKTPIEPAIDPELATIGQKLVSTAGGFSCISCHAINELGATQVFESAGINFGITAARLQKSFFHQWVRDPQSVDPATKMPDFFTPDDKSPLVDILDGDGIKTREAFWHYLRLGEKMPAPPLQP